MPSPIFGVNIHTGGVTATDRQRIADTVNSRNLKRVRVDVTYNTDFTNLRDQCTKIRTAGGTIQGVLLISYQTDMTIYSGGSYTTIQQDAYSQTYNVVNQLKDIIQDWEMLDNIQTRPPMNTSVPLNSAQTSTIPYAASPAYLSMAPVLKGMANAIHDLATTSGLPLKAILGMQGRDWGFLTFLNGQGVLYDAIGWKAYPTKDEPTFIQNISPGPVGPTIFQPVPVAPTQPTGLSSFTTAQLNTILGGGSNVTIPDGIYDITAAINVVNNHVITATNRRRVIFKVNVSHTGAIVSEVSTNFTLRGIILDGNYANRTAREGISASSLIEIQGCAVTLDDCVFQNAPSYGVWSYSAPSAAQIINSEFYECWQPIRFDGNNVAGAGGLVQNNKFLNTSAFKSIQGVEGINTKALVIRGNVFKGIGSQEPTSHPFEGAWGNSIYVYNSDATLTEENTVYASYWSALVYGQNNTNGIVRRNYLSEGFFTIASNSAWWEQSGNDIQTIESNILDGGILIGDTGANHVTMLNNVVYSRGQGIDCSFAFKAGQIEGNRIIKKAGTPIGNNYGMYLWEKTDSVNDNLKIYNNYIQGFDIAIAINNSGSTGAVFGLHLAGNTYSGNNVNSHQFQGSTFQTAPIIDSSPTLLLSTSWYGTGGPLTRLDAFNKPFSITEFNSGEIIDPLYNNIDGDAKTEDGFTSNVLHLRAIRNQTITGQLKYLCMYELLDEPSKTAPANRYGLMFNLDTLKSSLVIATAFAGGTLSSTERTKIIGKGWMTGSEIDSYVAAAPAPAPAPTPAPTPAPAPSTAPQINTARHVKDFLQIGSFWIEDNRWGNRGLTEGAASYQYTQSIERALTFTARSGAAAKFVWKWPEFDQSGAAINFNNSYNEVKGFPCIIYGAKPGYFGSDQWPAWDFAVRLPDGVSVPNPPAFTPGPIAQDWQAAGGSVATLKPCGATPNNILPLRLPLSNGALVPQLKWQHNTTPSGRGHLAFDMWLQQTPDQGSGFSNASITHEVMIPMGNWMDYGRHPNGRNPAWYDHDVVIDGVTYHVYASKSNGVLAYTFGGLNGNFTNEETGAPRTGWKFIVFQHDGVSHPKDADGNIRLDLAKFYAHLTTVRDSRNIQWVRGSEYIASVELGVEMVFGTGDLTVFDYVFNAGASPSPAPAPTPAPPAPSPTPPPPAPTPAPVPAPPQPTPPPISIPPVFVQSEFNTRDQILRDSQLRQGEQNLPSNFVIPGLRRINITSSEAFFRILPDGSTSPTSISLTATPVEMTGEINWSLVTGSALLSSSVGSTINISAPISDAMIIRATMSFNQQTYSSDITLSKVREGQPIPVKIVVPGTVWSDQAATANVIGQFGRSPSFGDEVMISDLWAFAQSKSWRAATTQDPFGRWIQQSPNVNGKLIVSRSLNSDAFRDLNATQGYFQNNIGPTPGVWVPLISQSVFNVEAFTGIASINAASCIGVVGKNTATGSEGQVGPPNGFDFYAAGTGGTYGAFTGAHDALMKPEEAVGAEVGDIVVDHLCIIKRNVGNTLFEVRLSSQPNQKASLGILTKIPYDWDAEYVPTAFSIGVETIETYVEALKKTVEIHRQIPHPTMAGLNLIYQITIINAIGEGQINVCGEGGDIEAGDLIVCSSTPGKGMRQDHTQQECYTVAKAREGYSFSSPDEIAMIACIYLCG